MPNYAAHVTINLTALAAGAYVAMTVAHMPALTIAQSGISFVVATFLLSPDLDLKYSNPTKNWGVMRWLWLPYQTLSRHRGLSHSLLLSTFTRVLYLIAVALFAVSAVSTAAASLQGAEGSAAIAGTADVVHHYVRAAEQLLTRHGAAFAAAGVGIWLADVTHIVADRLLSAFKQLAKL